MNDRRFQFIFPPWLCVLVRSDPRHGGAIAANGQWREAAPRTVRTGLLPAQLPLNVSAHDRLAQFLEIIVG